MELAAVPGCEPTLAVGKIGGHGFVTLTGDLVGLVGAARLDGLDARLGVGNVGQMWRWCGWWAISAGVVGSGNRRWH
jgi:hypothetical protein